MPEEFENGSFTQKTHQIFSVHTTVEEVINETINGHFGFVFEENMVREVTSLSWATILEKLHSQDVFHSHRYQKLHCQIPPECVQKQLCFCDRLVWTVGFTVEIKLLHFQISHA